MEVEDKGSLPFLDVKVTKRLNGSLAHQVYRKKTHTEQYLHAESHHHPAQKLGVLNTLATRALKISDDEHLDEEKNHLLKVFKDNGYKKHQVLRAFQNASKRPRSKTQTNNDVSKVFLPYIQGTTDKLARILKKKNIGATFKPINTIRNSLRSVKDPIDPIEQKGVYMIPCSCGKQYIGETVDPLELEFKNMSLISSTIALVPRCWQNIQIKQNIIFVLKRPKFLPK
jgi:hypothetical protein